ncbi:MAG: hypothetical protein IJ043_10910 [Clostridia bacterium]|nr:hypothetical protein [Clostridia bacterium]
MNFWLILITLLLYFYTVTCTFFTAQIAAVKGRRKRWGWLGLLLGIFGFAIVCFVPNAKGVTGETNPIKAAFGRLKKISPIAVWILVAGVVVVVGGTFLATNLNLYLENRSHEKELIQTEEEVDYLTPSKVNGKVAGIFCGDGANFAVTEAGDLYGWGQVGLSALDESGKVFQNVKKVCAAGDTIYLLATDGILYARGNNANSLIPGQSAAYVESFVKVEGDVKDMALSETAGAILKNSGNLYVVGVNTYGQLGRNAERVADTNTKLASNVSKVVVTGRSLYYLTADGSVYGVGSNAYGQFGLGNKEVQAAPVKINQGCSDIAAGEDFTLVLKTDGSVWSAGNNSFGQLGRQPVEKLPVYEEGETPPVPAPAPAGSFGQLELAEVTKIEAHGRTAFALKGTEVYGWGHNHLGQLGEGSGNASLPILIHKKAAALAAGDNCTLILTEEGKLLGAGDGRNYQLGARNDGKGFGEIAEVVS